MTPPVGSLTVPCTVPAPPKPCADTRAADSPRHTTATATPEPRRACNIVIAPRFGKRIAMLEQLTLATTVRSSHHKPTNGPFQPAGGVAGNTDGEPDGQPSGRPQTVQTAISPIIGNGPCRTRLPIRRFASTIHVRRRTGRCLPVTRLLRQAYRVDHIERRRVAESRRAEHRRRALRDAARDGRPRGPHARPDVWIRSPAASHVRARPCVELVRACPRTSCRRSGFEGPFPYLARCRVCRPRLPARCRRALSAQRRASCGARRPEAIARRHRLRRQRRRRGTARLRGRHRRAGPGSRRHAATDVYVRCACRSTGWRHARTARCGTRALGGGAGDVRRLGAAPQSASSR